MWFSNTFSSLLNDFLFLFLREGCKQFQIPGPDLENDFSWISKREGLMAKFLLVLDLVVKTGSKQVLVYRGSKWQIQG